MKEQNIEKIFSDGLSNLEGNVSANSWSKIEQGLKQPLPEIAKGGASKSGLLNYGTLLAVVAGAGILAAIYFDTKKSNTSAENVLATMPKKEITASAPSEPQAQASVPATQKTAPQVQSNSQSKNANSYQQKNTLVTKQAVKAVAPINKANLAPKEEHLTTPTILDPKPQPATENRSNASEQKKATPPVITSHIPSKVNQSTEVKADETSNNSDNNPEQVATKAIRIYPPNAFSPNGDGNNDVFEITGEDLKEYIMTIYDSKGEEVFTTKYASEPWDGKLKNGDLAPVGKYTYVAYATDNSGSTHVLKEALTLTR